MEKEEWDYREEYKKKKDQYDLPKIDEIIKDFDIEKLADKETEFIVREVRRIIVEKILAYLNLFETLINPASPPMFVFTALRNQTAEEKKEMKELYKKMAKIQIKVMKLDTIYSEEKEAKFIKKTFNEWQELKEKIYNIIDNFDKNFDNGSKTLEKGYFN